VSKTLPLTNNLPAPVFGVVLLVAVILIMNLYKGETGDGSVFLLVAAKSKKKAAKMMQKQYEEDYDDGSGFKFRTEEVEKVVIPNEPSIITAMSAEDMF
jgi:hypothetical protein